MGVEGCGYATVIAQAVSALLCLIYIVKKFPILRLSEEDFRISFQSMGRLLALGIPMGLQFSITAIGTIIVQGAVNIYGAVYMAGFSAAGKLQNIIVTVFTAFGATVATYVGQNRGAGKMDRVHKGVRYTQIMVFVWSAVTMVLVYFLGGEMTLLFVSKTETEVLHAAEVYFRTVFWAYPFLGSIFIYRNALQGMGYGLVPMLGGVFELVARSLIVLLVAGRASFTGVCLADPAAWISALIPLIPYYIYVMKKYEKQKKRQIFLRTAQKEYTLGQKVEEGKGREVSSSEIRPGFSLSFPFPFSFGIREEVSYREVKKTYSKKEYQEILSLEFDRFCEDLRKKGVQILENDVKIYKDTQSARAKGTMILLESCGKERKTEHGNLGENNADTN